MKLNEAIDSIAASETPSRSYRRLHGSTMPSFDPFSDIVCRRHPEAYNSPANIFARSVVDLYLPAYNEQRELRSSSGKGMIFEAIAAEISSSGYRFCKVLGGKLVVMSEREVRLKIGHWLRDAPKRSQRVANTAEKEPIRNHKKGKPETKMGTGTSKSKLHATVNSQKEAQETVVVGQCNTYDGAVVYAATVGDYGLRPSCTRKRLNTKCCGSLSSSTWNNRVVRSNPASASASAAPSTSCHGISEASNLLHEKGNPARGCPSSRSSFLNDSKLMPISDPPSLARLNGAKVTVFLEDSSTQLSSSMADSVKGCKNSDAHDEKQELMQSLKIRQVVLNEWYKQKVEQVSAVEKRTSPMMLNLADTVGNNNTKIDNKDNNVSGRPPAANMTSNHPQAPGIPKWTMESTGSTSQQGQLDAVLDGFDNSAVKDQNREEDCIPTEVCGDPSPHQLVDGDDTCNENKGGVLHGASHHDFDGIDVDALFESSRSSWLDDYDCFQTQRTSSINDD